MPLTKSQVDKLGERLKSGPVTEADLRLLDEYRRPFAEACHAVAVRLRTELGLQPTLRPAKTKESIIYKLQRIHTKLSQMQDIAGCRVTVADIVAQDEIAARIKELFANARVTDRRKKPSHGYRAVHLIVRQDDRRVEIQLRTELQHSWAVISERLAYRFDLLIKYGGGAEGEQAALLESSQLIAGYEEMEQVTLRPILAGRDAATYSKLLAIKARIKAIHTLLIQYLEQHEEA